MLYPNLVRTNILNRKFLGEKNETQNIMDSYQRPGGFRDVSSGLWAGSNSGTHRGTAH